MNKPYKNCIFFNVDFVVQPPPIPPDREKADYGKYMITLPTVCVLYKLVNRYTLFSHDRIPR